MKAKRLILWCGIAIVVMAMAGAIFAKVLLDKMFQYRLAASNGDSVFCAIFDEDGIYSYDVDDSSYILLPTYATSNYWTVDPSLKDLLVNGKKVGKFWHIIPDVSYDISVQIDNEIINRKLMFKRSNGIKTVYIDTKSGSMDYLLENKLNKEEAMIQILDCDGTVTYMGELEYIKGRGNSTWSTFAKKPYAIKFSEKISLFGMQEQKKYVLLANAFDRSGISNAVAFDFAREIGLSEAPQYEFVDLYLNGFYAGNYFLCDPISTALIDDQISIKKNAKPTECYIVEKDIYYSYEENNFLTKDGNAFSMKEPEEISSEDLEEVARQVQKVETMIIENDPAVFDYLDLDSLAKRYLIDRLMGNVDISVSSTFFYKVPGDTKLYSGPVWDYDRCFGLMGWMVCDPTVEMESVRSELLTWYAYLEKNETFVEYCKDIYEHTMRSYVKELVESKVDAYAQQIKNSMDMNALVNSEKLMYYFSFEAAVSYVKYYLANRLNVYDEKYGVQLDSVQYQSTNKTHIILALMGDDTFCYEVPDGECFVIPEELDEELYDYWCFYENGLLYESNVPVLENMVLIAHSIEEDN